jgi:hypothetical protein
LSAAIGVHIRGLSLITLRISLDDNIFTPPGM